ncbi:MAG: CHAP domain-containing protein [Nannocystaceae bacterium]
MDTLPRLSPLPFVAIVASLALLGACVEDVADESFADSEAIHLRGGAALLLRPGTAFDVDELESREHYGATLSDDAGRPWFVRVEAADDALYDALGLDVAEVNGADLRFGVALDEGSGEECVVFVPLSDEAAVVASRPAGDAGCPEAASDVEQWLPEVSPTQELSLRAAFGAVVGSFNGVTAYSNSSTSYNSGTYSCCGLKWQCVEYVNRYYYQALGHKNLKGTGNANNYFGTAASKELAAYANGGTVKPQVGDMIVSNGGTYGHIGIIRAVGSTSVTVIHQNWANSTADDAKTLSMTVSGGKYTIAAFSASYPVAGWMRRTGCTPTVSSVSPTSAQYGKATAFTATGSCLPTTTTPWIANCANLSVTSVSSTQAKFTCTPSYAKGTQSGVIKHGPDGKTLRSFSVSVY